MSSANSGQRFDGLSGVESAATPNSDCICDSYLQLRTDSPLATPCQFSPVAHARGSDNHLVTLSSPPTGTCAACRISPESSSCTRATTCRFLSSIGRSGFEKGRSLAVSSRYLLSFCRSSSRSTETACCEALFLERHAVGAAGHGADDLMVVANAVAADVVDRFFDQRRSAA